MKVGVRVTPSATCGTTTLWSCDGAAAAAREAQPVPIGLPPADLEGLAEPPPSAGKSSSIDGRDKFMLVDPATVLIELGLGLD